jgi:hypothetical protein
VTRALSEQDLDLLKSITAASLLRGVVYGEENPRAWQGLTSAKVRIWLGDYFRTLGLTVVLDEAEQFAFLRTVSELPEGMPRLVRRHQLTFRMSVLLAQLRERLDETARDGQSDRTLMTLEQLVEGMRPYFDKTATDDKIGQLVTDAVNADFLRKLSGSDPASFEVRRHVRALVSSDWLEQFHDRHTTANITGDGSDRDDVADAGDGSVESMEDRPGSTPGQDGDQELRTQHGDEGR